MNNLVEIGNQEIAVKEYKGQRVVTFKDIDLVHERPEGTARRNFNANKEHLIQDEDYFKISPNEFRTAIGDMDLRQSNDITLLTEQGYLMLVKSFTDDLAWDVQRKLVNTYFNVRQPRKLTDREMMREQLSMIDEVSDRVTNLENNMTIDYGQQLTLEKLVKKQVIGALGGKDTPAYKNVAKKVFAECNRDIKDHFNVNSRNNIATIDFDKARQFITGWEPCYNTRLMIQDENNQMSL